MRALSAAVRRPKPDFDTVNALYHPEHVFVPIAASKLGEGEARGASGYRAWLESNEQAMPAETELEGAVDLGPGTVLAVTTLHFHGASSGIDLEQRAWLVVTVADGKLTRTEVFFDPTEALAAVGLLE